MNANESKRETEMTYRFSASATGSSFRREKAPLFATKRTTRFATQKTLGFNVAFVLNVLFILFVVGLLSGGDFEYEFRAAAFGDEPRAGSSVPAPVSGRSDVEPNVPFRYWKAPADSIDRWPWGTDKYFPIRISTFDEWLRSTAEQTGKNDVSQRGVVSSLRIDAKLDGDSLDGFGTLELSALELDSNARSTAAFPLNSFSFALSSFFEREGARKTFVGLYPDSQLYLANPKNGAYSFRWTRRGTADSFGTLSFDLTFPASSQMEFQLETPSDATLESSQGVVEKGAETDRETRRWRVFLGGKSQTRLTISRAVASSETRRLVGFQQETSYRLSLEGTEVVSRFVFDRSKAPLDEATLIFDDPLVPISIDWGDRKSEELGATQTSSLGTTKIKLNAPERRDGETFGDLKIVAFCPLELKNTRRLPSIRLLSDNFFWKETICRLTVVRPLVATSTTPIDAVQAREPLRTPQEGQDFFSFKFFEPNAGVVVKLQTAPTEPAFDSATDALIVAGEISAKTTLFFNCDRDDYFRLSIPLAPDWEIDAVQAPSDDQIVWSKEERDGARSLVVSFKTPPPPNQPTRVVLSARFATSFDGKIAVDRLCPIDLSNVLRGAHAASIRAESPNQVKLSTRAGRSFVLPKTPTPNFVFNESQLRDALPSPNGLGRFLYFGDQTADAVASLENLKSNYSAELSGVGELRKTTFVESWKLRCSPASGSRVDRIVFFVAPADERTVAASAPWTWSTSTEPDRALAARRLSAEDVAALGVPNDAAAFEIRLATSRSVPFELNLFRTVPATQEIQASLVFLPEASIKTADFIVESPLDYPFWTRFDALDAVPAPVAPADQYEPLKSAFRYNPVYAPETDSNALEKTPRLDVYLAPPAPETDSSDSTNDASESTAVDSTKTPNDDKSDVALAPPPFPLEVLSANAWCWFETFDSFYESNGTIRNRVSFFIENRGRASILLETPADSNSATTRAVWLDDRRVPWSVEPIDKQTNGVRVALPPERRFVCVGLEYYDAGPRLAGFNRLTPTPISCDVPVLSGIWNVWIPPEYQTCETTNQTEPGDSNGFQTACRAVVDFFSFEKPRADKIERVADRFLSRFGNESALRRVVLDAKKGTSENTIGNGAATGGSASVVSDPTWGDVFGTPTTLERLFAPEAEQIPVLSENASENDALNGADADAAAKKTATQFETPFGTLETPGAPFHLYVDRFYLARLQLTPTTAIAFPPRNDERDDDARRLAARTLESARLVLLFIDEDLAVLSTSEILSEFDSQATDVLFDASIRRLKSRSDARRLRRELLDEANPRYVAAASWRVANDAISPWKERAREETAPGWVRTTLPLDRAASGVRIADRYATSTVVLFCFIAFVVAVWRRSFAKPFFFVAAFGVCFAIRLVAPFELRLVATGASWGVLCSFGFYFVRFCAPSSTQPRICSSKRRGIPVVESVPDPSLEIVVRDDFNSPPLRRRDVGDADAKRNEDDESTQGFVDLSKLPPNTLNDVVDDEQNVRIQELETPSNLTRQTPPDDASYSNRQGTILMKTTASLALTLLFVAAFGVAFGDDSSKTTPAGVATFGETLGGFGTGVNSNGDAFGSVPTPLNSVETSKTKTAASNAASDDSTAGDAWREPFRVFVPIDDGQQTVGDYYWIPEELHETIRAALKARPRERNWRIVDARYEGVVNYNGFTETTALFNLKATYKVFLDAPNATISLPATQLVPDVGAKFDKQALAPVFEEGSKEFAFVVEDAEPGEHILELTLVPPQFSETNDQISLPIPRVPSSRLELSVPADAPELDVPSALGKVTRGAGRLVAELGPIDRLILSKADASGASGKSVVDVEQYLLMRTRPTQTDVRAAFHFQVVGGKTQTLQIACDPLYAFSGYCHCDRAEIESIEPPTPQNDSMRVSFKKPVSGSFVLNVDFVARNFSGVGQIPIPQISPERTRVSKSWLAISPGGGVECSKLPEAPLSTSAFQNAWEAPIDDAPIAVFDLLETPPGRLISTRLTPARPRVEETSTFVFRSTQIETRFAATVDAPTELFRLELETPTPFVVDSVALTDEKGTALETPSAFLSDEGLSLLFSTPLKGKYTLQINGRTKSTLDVARFFPVLRLKNVDRSAPIVRVFCAADVYLIRTIPATWNVLDKARADALDANDAGTIQDDVYRVDAYEIVETVENAPQNDAETETNDDAEAENGGPPADAASDEIVVRINNPQIVGRERTIVYRQLSDQSPTGGSWKAEIDYRLTVQRGRVAKFYVAADESYSATAVDVESNFILSETRLPNGGRAFVFEPKTPGRSTVEFRLVATLGGDVENVRLPRFHLAPTSERDDVSGVRRFAFLPARENATPIRWETQNLRPTPRRSESSREALQTALRSTTKSTAALALSGTATETILAEKIPDAVAEASDLTTDDFLVFETLGETGDATIAANRDRLQVSRAEHSFYWNSRREFFGTSAFSLRSSPTSDDCILLVPANYRMLEATVNGSRRRAERLDERRWRIDLDATRFVKRLEIAFQGVDEQQLAGGVRTPFERRAAVFNVDFPRVENAEPEQTVWTCAFDSLDNATARWQVYRRNVDENEPPRAPDRRERVRATREPIPFSDANEILFRLCVGKADALFNALEADAAAFANSRPDEFARRRARWNLSWNQCESEIARFVSPDRPSETLSDRQKAALYAVDGNESDGNGNDENGNDENATIDLTSTFDRWSLARYREILAEKKKLETTYRLAPDENGDEATDAPAVLSPQGIWALDRGAKTRLLFGLTRENVDRIVVVAPPKRFDFFASPWATAAFVLAATAIVLGLIRTDAKTRLFKSVLFGTLGAFGAFVFFALGWKIVGLSIVAFLAVFPSALSSATLRRAQKQNQSQTDDADALNETDETPPSTRTPSESDVGTTASATPPRPNRR